MKSKDLLFRNTNNMKKTFIFFAAVLLTAGVFGQAPEKMSYQAVIRNSSDALVSSTQIGMEINIRKGSPSGTIVYTETQTPTTNASGLVSVEIGGGAGFSAINWGSDTLFIETKTAVVPPLTTYTITGTSQLLSVPYALHAKTAEVISGGPSTPTFTIGQSYQGGIIFWLDTTGQHGLIASVADLAVTMQWYNGVYRLTGSTGDGIYAGSMNTAMIVATQMGDNQTGTFAAKLCADYSVMVGSVTYGDWYLPSKFELNLLYLQRSVVGVFGPSWYWSSTDVNNNNAWAQDFGTGTQDNEDKFGPHGVRAIRAF
jgi:hypothetical protein